MISGIRSITYEAFRDECVMLSWASNAPRVLRALKQEGTQSERIADLWENMPFEEDEDLDWTVVQAYDPEDGDAEAGKELAVHAGLVIQAFMFTNVVEPLDERRKAVARGIYDRACKAWTDIPRGETQERAELLFTDLLAAIADCEQDPPEARQET